MHAIATIFCQKKCALIFSLLSSPSKHCMSVIHTLRHWQHFLPLRIRSTACMAWARHANANFPAPGLTNDWSPQPRKWSSVTKFDGKAISSLHHASICLSVNTLCPRLHISSMTTLFVQLLDCSPIPFLFRMVGYDTSHYPSVIKTNTHDQPSTTI